VPKHLLLIQQTDVDVVVCDDTVEFFVADPIEYLAKFDDFDHLSRISAINLRVNLTVD
jgi:hypothetical protein